MRQLFAPLALAAASLFSLGAYAADAHAHPHWAYNGKAGAAHWGDLQEGYATCKLGKTQSPIDIRQAKKSGDAKPLAFAYTGSPAEVVNNGHTIQVNLASAGEVATPGGAYKLVQFHFHTPSEEKVNGKAYPLVAHLVHKNDAGQLAVVAVLFKEGKDNALLGKVFKAMPKAEGGKASLEGGLNVADLLPAQQGYWAFSGSLTTPPCSEQVRWQVLKTPVEVSKSQLAAFRKLYPMNARPVQPLNGREVLESL